MENIENMENMENFEQNIEHVEHVEHIGHIEHIEHIEHALLYFENTGKIRNIEDMKDIENYYDTVRNVKLLWLYYFKFKLLFEQDLAFKNGVVFYKYDESCPFSQTLKSMMTKMEYFLQLAPVCDLLGNNEVCPSEEKIQAVGNVHGKIAELKNGAFFILSMLIEPDRGCTTPFSKNGDPVLADNAVDYNVDEMLCTLIG